jgi:xylulokinase
VTFVLGIDVSTTATKAVILDRQGAVVASGASTYPYEMPRPLWSEQDPALWWTGTIDAIGSALREGGIGGEEIEGVGLAGQMHGLVALDGDLVPVRPAILWNDQRTQAECELIRATIGRERLIAITGNDALPGFTAPKLVWVRRHEPDVWSRIAHVLLPKDFVRLRLTDDLAVDRADGAGTLLFDLAGRDWSNEVLDLLAIDRSWLPPTHEGPEVVGRVSRAAAEATGLARGTPVVAGGGDQAAAAVGVGATESGIVSVSLGTSGVVFATTDGPLFDPEGRLHAFCHAVPERWHVMGVILSAGGSLRWYRDALAPDRTFEELTEEAAEAPPGSDGLLFLPYLTGERTPHADPLARGAFVGLRVDQERAHLTRAVLEGVAFALRDCLGLMLDVGMPAPSQVRATGGGSRSPLWLRILSDVLGARVATTSTSEGAAQGAAMLATVGVGWFPSVHEAGRAFVGVTEVAAPSGDVLAYAAAYERYRALYPALVPTFHALRSD